MEQAVTTAVGSGGFLTTLVANFTSNQAFVFLLLLTVVAMAFAFLWFRKNEIKALNEISEARKLTKQIRDNEQELQNKEIEALKTETKEARQKLDDYVTKVEFSDYKDKIRGMEREITEIHRTCFTKTDAREIFSKIDGIRESLDRFKDNIFASRGDKQ